MQEEVENALEVLLDYNSEMFHDCEAFIVKFLSNSDCFPLLIQIILKPKSVRTQNSALAYFGKSINSHYKGLDIGMCKEIQEFVLQFLFNSGNSNQIESVSHIVSDMVNLRGLDHWPELLNTVSSCFSGNTSICEAIMILTNIMDYISESEKLNSMQLFINIIDLGIHIKDWQVRVNTVSVLGSIAKLISDSALLNGFITEILGFIDDPSCSEDNTIRLWVSVSYFISNNMLNDELISGFFSKCLQLSSNSKYSPYHRFMVLDSIIGTVKHFEEEQLSIVFSILFDVCPLIIEKDHEIMSNYGSIIEAAFDDLDNSFVYNILKGYIVSSFETDNNFRHAFSIAVLQIVLIYSPEEARNDLSFILETLETALDSNNDLLCISVCRVLESFDATFTSSNVFSTSFFSKLIPFFSSNCVDLVSAAFDAESCLIGLIDSQFEGVFYPIWNLHSSINEDFIEQYYSMLSAVILKSKDFGDEELDIMLDFVSGFFDSSIEIEKSSAILPVIASILTYDNDQADFLLPQSLAIADSAINDSTNAESIVSGIHFVDAIYSIFRLTIDSEYSDVKKSIFKWANRLKEDEDDEEDEDEEDSDIDDENVYSQVRIEAVGTSCLIAHLSQDSAVAKEMQERICFMLGIQDNTGEIKTKAMEYACEIVKLLDSDDAKHLFLIILAEIKDTASPRLVAEAIKPFTKLIRHASQENVGLFVSKSYELLNDFFEGKLLCLKGRQPTNGNCDVYLMTNVSYLICDFFRYPSEEVDSLCQVLLGFVQDPNGIITYSFVGALSDAIKYGTASTKMVSEILQILPYLVENAIEPDLQQNLCFILNIIVQRDDTLIPEVMALIPNVMRWYNTGITSLSGYGLTLSNIASLFMTLATKVENLGQEYILAAFGEFPCYDNKETEPMAHKIIEFLESGRNLSNEVQQAACKSISGLFLMNEASLQKHRIPNEVSQTLFYLFKQLVHRNPALQSFIQITYKKSRSKLDKILGFLLQ